jgi:hypothetical protein
MLNLTVDEFLKYDNFFPAGKLVDKFLSDNNMIWENIESLVQEKEENLLEIRKLQKEIRVLLDSEK